MIENLDEIFETVNFKENLGVRVYHMLSQGEIPEHWHTPIEIIRCISSTYGITVGSHTVILEEGDIAIIRPGIIHTLFSQGSGSRTIYLADVAFLQKLLDLETIFALISPVVVVSPKSNPNLNKNINRLLLEIESEYKHTGYFFETLIYSMFIEIVALLGREYIPSGSPDETNGIRASKYSGHFLQICRYINTHCTENLTLEQVANLAGFSKYHFSRLFKQFTHITFYKYLNQKRIAHAEQLLVNPEYSISGVALRSGFTSQSAFIRMFKQIKGCTPTKFRSQYSPSSGKLTGSINDIL